jgi:hypothetical protein
MDEKDKSTYEKINRMLERITNNKTEVLDYYNALLLGVGCRKNKPMKSLGFLLIHSKSI